MCFAQQTLAIRAAVEQCDVVLLFVDGKCLIVRQSYVTTASQNSYAAQIGRNRDFEDQLCPRVSLGVQLGKASCCGGHQCHDHYRLQVKVLGVVLRFKGG